MAGFLLQPATWTEADRLLAARRVFMILHPASSPEMEKAQKNSMELPRVPILQRLPFLDSCPAEVKNLKHLISSSSVPGQMSSEGSLVPSNVFKVTCTDDKVLAAKVRKHSNDATGESDVAKRVRHHRVVPLVGLCTVPMGKRANMSAILLFHRP